MSEASRPYGEDLWRRSAAVAYQEACYGEDPYQRIALVRPERPNGRVFLFFHGGNWTSGYKEWNLFMAPLFCEAGVIFASAGYRLAPHVLFPENFRDCVRSLVWINRNIAQFGGTPDQVFIGGHSAGGHLSSLLGVTQGWRRENNLPNEFLRGCLPISGIYRFGIGSGLAKRPRFLGEADSNSDQAASPILQIAPPIPPFLIAYGENDYPHLITQAQEMISELRSRRVEVEEISLSNKTHNEAHVATGDRDGLWARAALKFIARH